MADKNHESKVKELARKKSNKSCFDCGKSGPHNAVVLDFNTFVCTTCAGLHRNFSHKVKSINMSNFSKPELDALAHGGNKKAKKIWLATYSPEAFPVQPDDEKNIMRFMQAVYEKRQWYDKDGASKKHKKKDKKPKKEEEDSGSEEEEHGDSHPSSTPSHKSSDSAHASSHDHHSHHGNSTPTPTSNSHENHAPVSVSAPKKDLVDLLSDFSFSESTPAPQPVQDLSFETSFDSGSSAAAAPSISPANMQQAVSAITKSLQAVQQAFSLTPQALKQCVDQALASLGSSGGGPSSATSPSSSAAPAAAARPAEKPVSKVHAMLASVHSTPPPMPGAVALPGFGASPSMGGMAGGALPGFGGLGANAAAPAGGGTGNPFDDDYAGDDGSAAAAAYYARQPAAGYPPQQQQAQYQQAQYPGGYPPQQQYAPQQYAQQPYGVQPGVMMQPAYYPQQMAVQQAPVQARPRDDLFSFANPLSGAK